MTVRQGDYVLQTNFYNCHYMIIKDNGVYEPKMVMHCACTKRLNEKEAKEHLNRFLEIQDALIGGDAE